MASPSTGRPTKARPAGPTSSRTWMRKNRRPAGATASGADDYRVTFPALMQPVHTWIRLGVPLIVARTRWMLGSKRRLVIFRDHGRLLPKPGFLWQMSQTAAIGGLLGDVETCVGA